MKGKTIRKMLDRGRAEVDSLPVPICPRCGNHAEEVNTKYGIRASCCGLWSWERRPLVDADTHQARRELTPLMQEVAKALGQVKAYQQIAKRVGFSSPDQLKVSNMNEATARKVKAAVEDIIMDIMAGEVAR